MISENDPFQAQDECDRLISDTPDEETRLILTKCIDSGICVCEAIMLLEELRDIRMSGNLQIPVSL